MELKALTDNFVALGEDEYKSFWLKADLCSFEEYKLVLDDEDEEWTEEQLRGWFEEDYRDDSRCWFHFECRSHDDRRTGQVYYGVFIDNDYVLAVNDPNC